MHWRITSHLKFQELESSCAVMSIILNSVGCLGFTFKLYTTYNSFPLKYILLDLAVGSYVRWRNKLNLMTDSLSDLLDWKWHRRTNSRPLHSSTWLRGIMFTPHLDRTRQDNCIPFAFTFHSLQSHACLGHWRGHFDSNLWPGITPPVYDLIPFHG